MAPALRNLVQRRVVDLHMLCFSLFILATVVTTLTRLTVGPHAGVIIWEVYTTVVVGAISVLVGLLNFVLRWRTP